MSEETNKFYTEEIKKFVDEISTDSVNGLRFLVILYDFAKPMLSKIRAKGGVA